MANYKLTKEDKALLKRWGYPRQEQDQIEEAINRSTYKLEDPSRRKVISKEKAIEILGKETFLSGIIRRFILPAAGTLKTIRTSRSLSTQVSFSSKNK